MNKYKVVIELCVESDVELDMSELDGIVCDELADQMRQDILSAAVVSKVG